MVGRCWRSRTSVLALSLALVLGLAVPAIAVAALPPEIPVAVPFSDAATLTWVPDFEDHEYAYILPLTAGQTIEMTSTASAETDHYTLIFSTEYSDSAFVVSDPISSGVQRLRYMAPHTGQYYALVVGSLASSFTINAVKIPAMKFALNSMVVPKSIRRYKTLTASVSIAPGYDSSVSPIRMCVQRLVSGHWKAYTSKAAKATVGSATYSKFSARIKFSRRGTFRVRARFMDAAHKTPKYNRYKKFYVK